LYTIEISQKIPATVEKVWEFISSPRNLKLITPDDLGFEVTTKDPAEKMYAGMLISYSVKPLFGIKMKWVTEISHIKEPEYFIDQQYSGPYKYWHHKHELKAIDGGVLMTDIINYKPPYGFLGAIANSLAIRKRLDEILKYRKAKLEEIFGKFKQ
jgi:ligand-binding SRPBCC domain-containing protein